MRDYLYLSLYKFFTLLAKILPKSVMDYILKALASFAYRVDKKHHHIINANLKLAFGDSLNHNDRDSIGKYTFYNLLQTIIGFIKRDGKDIDNILKDIEFKNSHILEDAIKSKRKIILITAHYGNWELLPPAIASKFRVELIGVGRKLDSPVMDRVLIKNREQFGVKMIYRKGAMKALIRALKANKIVGVLLDQHLGEKQGGVEVNFFNKKVFQSPIASILARNFNAIVIPAFISTDDYKNYIVTFYNPLPTIKTHNIEDDILKMTQAQSDIMQEVISNRPKEWFWVHRRWKGFYPEIYRRETD